MPWMLEYGWLVMGTGSVVVAVLNHYSPFIPPGRGHRRPSGRKLVRVAARHAILSYTVLYLFQAYLKGELWAL